MNKAFETVIAASDGERSDFLLVAAARLGTAVHDVEKDFWVCWTLDAMFNGLDVNGPGLLFKGGTSREAPTHPVTRHRHRGRCGHYGH